MSPFGQLAWSQKQGRMVTTSGPAGRRCPCRLTGVRSGYALARSCTRTVGTPPNTCSVVPWFPFLTEWSPHRNQGGSESVVTVVFDVVY